MIGHIKRTKAMMISKGDVDLAKKYSDDNVRKMINKPQDISTMMKPYENKLLKILGINPIENIKYSYPWNRKFEIEVDL